jgi:hypothetical protein
VADWFGYAYIDELPDDGTQEHEVYARFGLAAYAAQKFEIGVVNLLTVAGLTEVTASNSMDEQFAAFMGKTAGAPLHDVHAGEVCSGLPGVLLLHPRLEFGQLGLLLLDLLLQPARPGLQHPAYLVEHVRSDG